MYGRLKSGQTCNFTKGVFLSGRFTMHGRLKGDKEYDFSEDVFCGYEISGRFTIHGQLKGGQTLFCRYEISGHFAIHGRFKSLEYNLTSVQLGVGPILPKMHCISGCFRSKDRFQKDSNHFTKR